MKRVLLVLAMCLPMILTAQQKVAVYVTSDAEGVDDNTKEIIGGELVAAIVNTNKYKAVERTADFLQQISKEQGYQHSGNVDIDQISAIGKQLGVNYVCVANIMAYRNTYYIQARMIDVETAIVQNTARETSTLANIEEIISAASKVAHTLISPEVEYQTPTADASTKKSDRERYKSAQKRSYSPTEKPEGQIVRNSSSERSILGMKEFSYGKTEMDRKAYADFLFKNCPNAYIKWYKGNQMVTAGWILFGVGAAMVCVGFPVMASHYEIAKNAYPTGYADYWYEEQTGKYSYNVSYTRRGTEDAQKYKQCSYDFHTWGLTIGIIGGCAVISSVTILPIGYKYRKQSMNIFNEQCAYKRTASCTLNLQSSSDGLGIALRF